MKCVLRLSCVVHGPIYGRFMGCTGFLSGYITGLHLYFELGLPVISLVDWSVWEGEGGGGGICQCGLWKWQVHFDGFEKDRKPSWLLDC